MCETVTTTKLGCLHAADAYACMDLSDLGTVQWQTRYKAAMNKEGLHKRRVFLAYHNFILKKADSLLCDHNPPYFGLTTPQRPDPLQRSLNFGPISMS